MLQPSLWNDEWFLAMHVVSHGVACTNRSQLGAIPETFLVLWTGAPAIALTHYAPRPCTTIATQTPCRTVVAEIATDLQLDGKYADALSTLDQADQQLAGALTAEAEALVHRQRAFLHDCAGEYAAAARTMARARKTAESEDPMIRLDDLLRHRWVGWHVCVRSA